jgi:hypothetical protein
MKVRRPARTATVLRPLRATTKRRRRLTLVEALRLVATVTSAAVLGGGAG